MCHFLPFPDPSLRPSFVALERQDLLRVAAPGATVLLNAPYPPEEIWDRLPRAVQATVIAKKLRLFTIDAGVVAREVGLGARTNTVLQTCFFAISGVLPREEAIAQIKGSIRKSYEHKGQSSVVDRNFAAVDGSLARLSEVKVPLSATSKIEMQTPVPASAPAFVRNVTERMFAGMGEELPVSLIPADGTFPSGTSVYEKRNISSTALPTYGGCGAGAVGAKPPRFGRAAA